MKKHSSLFYSTHGEGAACVLVHGFGEDSRIWTPQIEFLSSEFRLIIPDLRGSGKSATNAVHNLSIESMAEDIKVMLDAEQIDSCTLIGHSMGGYIALAFAEKYPHLLRGLGLIHSTSYADSEEKKEIRRKGIAFIQEHGAESFLRATIPNLYAQVYKTNQPEKLEELLKWSMEFKRETLIAYYESMIQRPDRTNILNQIKQPVLMIIGTEDKAVSPTDALNQSTLPAQCQLCLLPDVAHMGMWEATHTVNQELLAFLQWTA